MNNTQKLTIFLILHVCSWHLLQGMEQSSIKPEAALAYHLQTQPDLIKIFSYPSAPAAYSADGKQLALGNKNNAEVLDATTLQPVATLAHDNQIADLAFHKNAPRYLGTTTSQKVSSWDITTKKQLAWKKSGSENPTIYNWGGSAARAPDTINYDPENTWKSAPATLLTIVPKLMLSGTDILNIHPRPEYNPAKDESLTLTVFKETTPRLNRMPLFETSLKVCASNTYTGTYIMDGGGVAEYEESITNERPYLLSRENISSASFSSNGALLALIASNVSVWNTTSMINMLRLKEYNHYPQPVLTTSDGLHTYKALFSPDSKYLITAARKKNADAADASQRCFVTFWDIANKTRLFTFVLPTVESKITSLAMHPNGNQLVTGGNNNAYVWNLPTTAETQAQLEQLTEQQRTLLTVFEEAMKRKDNVELNAEQSQIFASLPTTIQNKLNLYIEAHKQNDPLLLRTVSLHPTSQIEPFDVQDDGE